MSAKLGFMEYFEDLPEPRQERKILYPLAEVLFLVLCGVISGCSNFTEIALYGREKKGFLKRFFSFKQGVPSHDTIGNVFKALDSVAFRGSFTRWTQSLQENIREIVSMDGKTVRGSKSEASREL